MAALIQFLAGNYSKAIEIAASAPGEETKELDAWAHIMEDNALSEQAETKSGAEADGLYQAAAEKLSRAKTLGSEHAAYNLACLAIRQGREEALSWLIKAREAGTLPGRAQLDQDPDLDSICGSDQFLADLEA